MTIWSLIFFTITYLFITITISNHKPFKKLPKPKMMTKENIKIWPFKIPQIPLILQLSDIYYTSPWLKKILKFDLLKCPRFTTFWHSFYFTMVEEIFKIWPSEMLQIHSILPLFKTFSVFRHVWYFIARECGKSPLKLLSAPFRRSPPSFFIF